ncbi:hypothetical protein B4U79_19214 [Dinothrombium tinctorium]|uniref:FCP1 homology domain-containing protein n=1 Tax=Dinothrombium tinctorium TaxID=1965070 RepID=A0A443Q8F0_9ACAR|nr:hypothetical protein B4U79_19214 [Dinothrombium tinctorium]
MNQYFYNSDINGDIIDDEKEIQLRQNPDTYYIPPLILVVDLDNTLIFADEERITSYVTNELPCFFRPEMYSFFEYMKKNFGNKILQILWSTGMNSYVTKMVNLLKLTNFDFIFGRDESNYSYTHYGAYKSPQFLYKKSIPIKKWISDRMRKSNGNAPFFAIIDDKAKENTDSICPYNYTFCPEPFDLKSFKKLENGEIIAEVESLFRYAYILIDDLILKKQPKVDIKSAIRPSFFLEEFKGGEYIFKPEPVIL